NPTFVFERLFRAANPLPGSGKRDKALLDLVLDDAKQLRQDVGVADRHRIDEYLSVVRSLEDRLERAGSPERTNWKARAKINPETKPDGIPKSHAEHVRLMFDMI